MIDVTGRVERQDGRDRNGSPVRPAAGHLLRTLQEVPRRRAVHPARQPAALHTVLRESLLQHMRTVPSGHRRRESGKDEDSFWVHRTRERW